MKKKEQPKTWITKEEYHQLISNPHLPRKDDLIIQLLYSCAFRVSEVCNIKVKDIDIENATITIWQSKHQRKPALVPVPALLIKRINQWILDNNLAPNRFLFFSSHQKKISRTLVHHLVKKAGKTAGLTTVLTTHTFRRSRATHLLDAGLPLEKVSQLLRHQYLSSTMIYLKISVKGLQDAINKIDKDNS